jgi:hypothetical protein
MSRVRRMVYEKLRGCSAGIGSIALALALPQRFGLRRYRRVPRPQGGIGPRALSEILSDKDGSAGADAGTNAGKTACNIGCSIDCSIVGSIVGTWRLVMTRAHDDAGKPMHAPYGPIPMGVVMFSADGRMVAVLCDARPQLPADEEAREYSSYCVSYTDQTIVCKIKHLSSTIGHYRLVAYGPISVPRLPERSR